MEPTKKTARTAGLFYLAIVFGGMFYLRYVPVSLFDRDHAAAGSPCDFHTDLRLAAFDFRRRTGIVNSGDFYNSPFSAAGIDHVQTFTKCNGLAIQSEQNSAILDLEYLGAGGETEKYSDDKQSCSTNRSNLSGSYSRDLYGLALVAQF